MAAIWKIFCLVAASLLSSCAYLDSLSRQNEILRTQKSHPSQYAEKHLIERQTYFVYGRLISEQSDSRHSMAVTAISDKYRKNEVVDTNHLGQTNSYYGLNLPEGVYRLLVLEDRNDDNIYNETEIIGQREIDLSPRLHPGKVVGNVDINLRDDFKPPPVKLGLSVRDSGTLRQSLFFPKGSIRSMEDPIFSEKMATLGLYDPAVFIENAPMMFYALEEDAFQKVPVVFVHGIGGTVREFQSVIDRLDRTKYKPWFFYYASGTDLNKLSRMFYDIFLSGNAVKRSLSGMVIVAHSMGGLVVREAMNRYQGNEHETNVRLFISIASPFGGMSSARSGVEKAPMVIPSWRNLVPGGPFINNLLRKPIPGSIEHHLVYAYLNSGDSSDSDGVVTVSSQLRPSGSSALSGQYGFKSSHTGILRDSVALDAIVDLITRVKSPLPQKHMDYLAMGGFDVAFTDSYSELEKGMIRNLGIYLRGLANGELEPTSNSSHFLAVLQGKEEAQPGVDTAWLKFRKDYPDLATRTVE